MSWMSMVGNIAGKMGSSGGGGGGGSQKKQSELQGYQYMDNPTFNSSRKKRLEENDLQLGNRQRFFPRPMGGGQ